MGKKVGMANLALIFLRIALHRSVMTVLNDGMLAGMLLVFGALKRKRNFALHASKREFNHNFGVKARLGGSRDNSGCHKERQNGRTTVGFIRKGRMEERNIHGESKVPSS